VRVIFSRLIPPGPSPARHVLEYRTLGEPSERSVALAEAIIEAWMNGVPCGGAGDALWTDGWDIWHRDICLTVKTLSGPVGLNVTFYRPHATYWRVAVERLLQRSGLEVLRVEARVRGEHMAFGLRYATECVINHLTSIEDEND
jgi:hypothetical protein